MKCTSASSHRPSRRYTLTTLMLLRRMMLHSHGFMWLRLLLALAAIDIGVRNTFAPRDYELPPPVCNMTAGPATLYEPSGEGWSHSAFSTMELATDIRYTLPALSPPPNSVLKVDSTGMVVWAKCPDDVDCTWVDSMHTAHTEVVR